MQEDNTKQDNSKPTGANTQSFPNQFINTQPQDVSDVSSALNRYFQTSAEISKSYSSTFILKLRRSNAMENLEGMEDICQADVYSKV